MTEQIVLFWSGGKDCTLVLHALLQSDEGFYYCNLVAPI